MSSRTAAPDLLSAEFDQDPYSAYEVLLDHYPIFRDKRLGWVISRHVDVKRAFTDPAFSTGTYAAVRDLVGRSILELEGREHATCRRLVAPTFRGRALQSYREIIENVATELVEAFCEKADTDLVEGFCAQFPIHVIMRIMNLPRADYPQFQKWYRAAAAYVGNYAQVPEVAAVGLRAKRDLDAYLLRIVAERRAAPGDDLISIMCTAETDGVGMSDQEIIDFCSLLLAAGGETTERGLASTLSNLLSNPEPLAAVRADPVLAIAAFAEAIRLNPPTHIVLRSTTEDVELSAGSVPAGSVVFCLVGAANRDPRQYRDPGLFDPGRSELDVDRAFTAAANHLAFGAGRHFCVGAPLAKVEAEIGLRILLDSLPGLRFASGFMPVEQGLLTRGPRSLLVEY